MFRWLPFLLPLLCVLSPCFADDFADQVNLAPLRTLEIQHLQTLKTLDSFARQTMDAIRDRSSGFDGQSALYSVLDLSFRPERYADQKIIKIRNVPVRKDFQRLPDLSESEATQIVHDGLVSPSFLSSQPVQQLLADVQASAVFKAAAVNQALGAANNVSLLAQLDMPLFRIIPPPPSTASLQTQRPSPPAAAPPSLAPSSVAAPALAPPSPTQAAADSEADVWHNLQEISGNIPLWRSVIAEHGGTPPLPIRGYDGASLQHLIDAQAAMFHLREAWQKRDVAAANQQIALLAANLPLINPAAYPSMAKRETEVLYNRCLMLTIPAAALYFVAFVLFLMCASSGVGSLRLWGLRLIVLAWLVHLTGIGIRWWLVSTSVGNFFESIPIKNEFESVMMSAFFGVTLGIGLELRNGRGIFGAAASFVGCLSLVAIFAAPLVTGRQIGGEIGQVNGVLMSYWLYIHVTMVTAAYALITMGFCLSVWWLIRYYTGTEKIINDDDYLPLSGGSGMGSGVGSGIGGGVRGGGTLGGVATMSVTTTLARMLFVPTSRRVEVAGFAESHRSFLRTLDLCNLVVLQLAFWVLGAGIVCGAIWADQSWGRPWGWDPKETFALVTWIVYLIVVHVRVATEHKAWWTAVLSVIGFGVMLFNWIGVNFFLVGLHSYA